MRKLEGPHRADKGAPRLSDVAYEKIIESLLERRISVDAFVSQGRLSSIVGIPVAPLRDALHVLQAEGILTIRPRAGIEFIRPGHKLMRSIYEFRAIVERHAVRIFAEQADEQVFESLIRKHHNLANELRSDRIERWHQREMDSLEMELHAEVTASLHNPLINSTARRIRNHLRLLWLERKMTAPMLMSGIKEHLSILEACRTRSADAAELALLAHLRSAGQRGLTPVQADQ